jgi:hypothetical protein
MNNMQTIITVTLILLNLGLIPAFLHALNRLEQAAKLLKASQPEEATTLQPLLGVVYPPNDK